MFKKLLKIEIFNKNLEMLKKLSQNNSLPRNLLFYGDECNYFFPLVVEFLKYINCEKENNTCENCNNCNLINTMLHPDIKYIYPIVHMKDNDSCIDYFNIFRETFLKNPFCDKNYWQKTVTTTNKQMNILNNDVCDIKDFLSIPAFYARYKTIIIWLPELMNSSASNSLLKILEDPILDNSFFIFFTNNIDNILQTIRSRCLNVFLGFCDTDKINTNEEIKIIKDKYFDYFIKWMRFCYSVNYQDICSFVEEIHSWGKDEVNIFLQEIINIFNQIFYLKINAIGLCEKDDEKIKILQKLSNLISLENLQKVSKEINICISQISKNANIKIITFNLSMFLKSLFYLN